MTTNTAPPADLISRIRKILAKTLENNCTEAESEAAMALASRLMAAHNLDMASVLASDADQWVEETAFTGGQIRLAAQFAAKITEDYFFVSAYTATNRTRGTGETRTIHFFGTPANVETARFVFNTLIASMDLLWAAYRTETGCPVNKRQSYVWGINQGFRAKMDVERATMAQERDADATPGSTALALRNVVAEIRKAFDAAHDGKFRHNTAKAYLDHDVRAAGEQAGRNLNINRPLPGTLGPRAIERK